MAAIKAEDVRTSFLFVCDMNGHHQERLGSTTANHDGGFAFDFATVSGYDQLVVGSSHAHGLTLMPGTHYDFLDSALVSLPSGKNG